MLSNPNKIVKRDKKRVYSRIDNRNPYLKKRDLSQANSEKNESNKADTLRPGTVMLPSHKKSLAVYVNKRKCMEENLPETKRTKKRKNTFFIR
jgi:hypothetical protein